MIKQVISCLKAKMFELNKKIPFEEFRKTIYHHARTYEIPRTDPYEQCKIVKALIMKAREEEVNRCYSKAFYYANKCLLFFDRDENSREFVKKNPSIRQICVEALDLVARLEEKGLHIEYNAMMKEIDRREPERRRIVARQLEPDCEDNGGSSNTSSAVDMHLMKQRQLLSSESINLDELLQQLHQTSIPDKQGHTSLSIPGGPLTPQQIHTTNYTPQVSPPLALPEPSGNNNYSISTPGGAYANCVLNSPDASFTVPRRGLVNLGNTCYLNSVLQVLYSTPLGRYFLTDDYVSRLITKKGKLTRLINSFSFVIRELNRTDCDFSVSVSPFKSALGDYYEGLKNSKQQDANEFLRVLLDGLHGALNMNDGKKTIFPEIDNSQGTDDELAHNYWTQYYQKNSSVVVDHCAFQERSSLLCPSCGHQSRSFNICLSIEIPIPSTSSKISLDDCFSAYCREEILDNNSMYMCPHCHRKVNARKQMLFYSVPSVLFITLKRFRSYGNFTSASKVNSSVFFSKTLSIAPYMCSSFSKTTYHLVGIINHQGNMHGGHYTADALGSDGVWCNFSDERVTKADMADNKQAYILCYVR